MKNKTAIITASIILFIFVVVFFIYFWFIAPEKKVAQECQGFTPGWLDFIECSGVVAISDGWDVDYISIRDHIHDYEIARVYDKNQYVFTGNKLFVINLMYIENSASNDSETTYYQKLFQNGQLVQNPYDTISDIPTYLVVDTRSGEVLPYEDIDDVPESERGYFNKI